MGVTEVMFFNVYLVAPIELDYTEHEAPALSDLKEFCMSWEEQQKEEGKEAIKRESRTWPFKDLLLRISREANANCGGAGEQPFILILAKSSFITLPQAFEIIHINFTIKFFFSLQWGQWHLKNL